MAVKMGRRQARRRASEFVFFKSQGNSSQGRAVMGCASKSSAKQSRNFFATAASGTNAALNASSRLGGYRCGFVIFSATIGATRIRLSTFAATPGPAKPFF